MPISRWQYDFEATAEGCRVTESTWDRRPGWFKTPAELVTGTRNRRVVNAAHIARHAGAAQSARGDRCSRRLARVTRVHRVEALAGAGRYAVTFQRPDNSEQSAVVQVSGGQVTAAEASLPDGWTRESDAFAALARCCSRSKRARALGPSRAQLVDVDGGWDVMMGNVVLGDSGKPTCTAHGAMEASDDGVYECAECGARALSDRHLMLAAADRPGPLGAADFERVRLHPYWTERILGRCPGLAHLAAIAGSHHERLDGSGYHRGATATQLTAPARLLAAADCFATATEARPHRRALSRDDAAGMISREVAAGRLDRDACAAVVEASGLPRPRADLPNGLTEREVEVLRLAARGLSNRAIADELHLSDRTVGHHLAHVYDKIDRRTRAGAAVFAVEHGLLPG